VAGAQVVVERRAGGVWSLLATVTTDTTGRASAQMPMRRDPADNVVRASYAGDATYAPSVSPETAVALVRRVGRVRIGGPARVVDERSVELTVRWTTRNGTPVSGPVRVQRRDRQGRWRPVSRLETDAKGRASLAVSPRVDTRWRVTADRLPWVTGDRSRVHRLDNLPPGAPVVLPARAPEPRIALPPQRS
jgi:5-hydroxyisourate hydrolase-like protein (transthyretin family)